MVRLFDLYKKIMLAAKADLNPCPTDCRLTCANQNATELVNNC